MDSSNLSIRNLTKGKLTSLPFEEVKNEILGSKYELSLVFIGEKKSRALNTKYRQKNKVANVLSFPLSKNSGEIFITPSKAKTECIKFNLSFKKFLVYLFIHGLLHLKGMEHGSRMDKAEEKIKRKFEID